ncbi:MAG: flavodoxin domain-containing protein, partial [Nanoarchaeota archaeon]
KIMDYDTIIYGGGLYAVGILGFKKLIKKNYNKLRDKKLVVFSVGMASDNEETRKDIINRNFSEEMKEKIKYFHLRGRFDYEELNVMDKILMQMLKFMLKRKKEPLTNDEKGVLKSFEHKFDWMSKKNIQPIIDEIKN